MLHERVSAKTLGIARICVFGMWLVHVLFDRIPEMADMPVELMVPAGVLHVVPDAAWSWIWTPAALWALTITLLTGLTLLVLGTRGFSAIAVVTTILLTLYQGMPRSFGFVNHAQLALLYVAYILAVFPCTDALAVSPPREHAQRSPVLYSAPMLAVSLIFLLAYTLLAIRRLCVGGLDIFLDDTILYHVGLRAAAPGGFPIPLGLYLLERLELRLLLQIGYPVITAFELLSVFCLFSRYFRWAWISVILSFHVGTWLLMGIFFPMFMLIIVVFLTDIDRLTSSVFTPPARHLSTADRRRDR